ncbi:hypothetical protein [Herbidospora daliensis]|uniref:hypothetical protein n=1 Tax=Herbidospora daliensis TaxID=295585 RepID=UPI000784B748|nr:hypothetical protein [Herbidospora daliensis]
MSVLAGTRTSTTGLISTGIVTGTARNARVGRRTTGSQTHPDSPADAGRGGVGHAPGGRTVSLRSQVTSTHGPRISA